MHARRVRVLHKGNNSKVVLAELTSGWKGLREGDEVVLKTGPLALNEIDLLMRSDHPNVLRALDVLPVEGVVADIVGNITFFGRDDVWVATVLPKADGDLINIISPENSVPLAILYQIALGLAYLHRGGVLHADIKPANVLMFGERPVLADFGTTMTLYMRGSDWPQSWDYKPPEAYAPYAWFENASKSSDVWALGMLMINAVSGAHPYGPTSPSIKEDECKELAVKMSSDPSWPSEPGFYREGYAGLVPLIIRMMAESACARPSMEEILEDPVWEPVRRPGLIVKELQALSDGYGDVCDDICQAYETIRGKLPCNRKFNSPAALGLAQQIYDRCVRAGIVGAAGLSGLPELCISIVLDCTTVEFFGYDRRDDVLSVCGRLGWKIVEA